MGNDVSYSDEYDKLSELEVAQEHSSFGRWFLDDGLVCTWVILPETELLPLQKLNIYCFTVEKLQDKESCIEVLREVEDKTWVGQKGIKSLSRVIKYVNKKRKGEK